MGHRGAIGDYEGDAICDSLFVVNVCLLASKVVSCDGVEFPWGGGVDPWGR